MHGDGKHRSQSEIVVAFTKVLRAHLDGLGCHCEPTFRVIEPMPDVAPDAPLNVKVFHVTPCPRPVEELVRISGPPL